MTGWSLCGESVIRAAAFEHRLAVVVADPGVTGACLAWPAVIRELFAHDASKQQVNHWPGDHRSIRFAVVTGATPAGSRVAR
jgi:hypothetical protein